MQDRYEYQIICSADAGSLADGVGKLIKSVNNAMSSCGVHEKLSLRCKISIGTLTTSKPISQSQSRRMRKIMNDSFAESELMRKHGIEVVALRRKSSQSRSQSKSR